MRPSLSRVGAIRFCSVELGCVGLFGLNPRWHLTATLARPPVGAMTFGGMRDEPPRPSDQDFADDEEAAHYNCEKEQELFPSVRIVLVLRSGRTVRKAGHARCIEEVREWPKPPPSRKGAAKCVCIPTRERCAGCWKNYASLIPLSGALPPEDKARMQDLERELLKLGCIVDLDLDSLVTPL
jgi:hypothetical protein